MSKYLIFFLCFTTSYAFSQNDLAGLNTDWRFFQKALYKIHPSTFRYYSKDSMDVLFDSLSFRDQEQASALEMEKRLRIVLKKVGCIHSNVDQSVFEHNGQIIPFSIYNNNDQLWIHKDFGDSLSNLDGMKLLSINGHLAENLLDTMRAYRSADGYGTDFMDLYMNQWTTFSYLYQYYFDADSIKTYQVIAPNQDTIQITRKNITAYNQNEIPQEGLSYGKHIWLNFDTLNSIAILKISSFHSIFPIMGKYVNQRKYKKALKQAQKLGYQNLVLDLRGNLGGDASAGKALISFFIRDKFKFKITRTKGRIFKYITLGSKMGCSLDFFFGNILAMRRPTWKRKQTTITVRKNRRYHYDGPVVIFTDGFTASTSSIVASSLKHKANAKIIGQESGGGANDLNAYYYPVVELPYSKIKIRLPLYHIDLDLDHNATSGVRPDVFIQYDITDILSEKNLELEAARKIFLH